MKSQAIVMKMHPTGMDFSERVATMYADGYRIATSFYEDGLAIVVWEKELETLPQKGNGKR